MISDYPYVAKHYHGRNRKYHVDCALRIGLASLVQMPDTDRILGPVQQA
jgi:hypothetical protein